MSTQTSSGGIGFIGLLQIVFIVLKLIGKIDWSWWWVTAPTWICAILCIVIPFIFVFALSIYADAKRRRW